ncbi:hypothetical protein M9194_01485 [Vibrio sp. S4M6]|uniref:hypothetical protein n=1 Tax=Vibrio sinus TaxID=2946865 RepID=UPI00202A1C27|nr:hypothetical protein [Vibrio sinus]MCL9780101.1 hypothetical protein [Vibrio sinus]
MNMLTFGKNEIENQEKSFVAEAVFAVETISAKKQQEKQIKAKQLLDTLFPLESGSHQNVTAYVIDYRHVMAYFKDGSHSGLQHPKHFVAYNGEKENPASILLKDAAGSHVEVTFGCHKGTGNIELVNIADVQLETCTKLCANSSETMVAAMRHWVSLVKGDENGKPNVCSEDKEFVAKNGDDYSLGYCYSL